LFYTLADEQGIQTMLQVREGVRLSVKESPEESLRIKWAKYIVSSVLIHAAVFSVPIPFAVPRMTGPIEVFMLEGPGYSAPSGGVERKDRPRGKPRLEMRRPQAREEARLRPQEASRTVEQKAKPVRTTTENITVRDPAGHNDPAGGIRLKSKAAVDGGREEKTSFSGGSATGAGGGSGRGTGTGKRDAGFGSPSGPKFLHREIPEYPFLARKRKIEGKVVLAVVIDATGRLIKAEVVEASDKAFAEASLEALRKSTFLPARRNGRPVASRAILPIRFSLTE